MSSSWVSRWVDGEVDTPWERDSYEDMIWDEPDWMRPQDWCSGCGELYEHCEWLEDCESWARLDDWCEAEAVPSDTEANLGRLRDHERHLVSRRRKQRWR